MSGLRLLADFLNAGYADKREARKQRHEADLANEARLYAIHEYNRDLPLLRARVGYQPTQLEGQSDLDYYNKLGLWQMRARNAAIGLPGVRDAANAVAQNRFKYEKGHAPQIIKSGTGIPGQHQEMLIDTNTMRPGFVGVPRIPAPTTNIQIDAAQKRADKAKDMLSEHNVQQIIDINANRRLAEQTLGRLESYSARAEGVPSGPIQPLIAAFGKTVENFLDIKLDTGLFKGLDKQEALVLQDISNALHSLQAFKGPTTDFEYKVALRKNPGLLTSPGGRKQFLDALRDDLSRISYESRLANEAYDAGEFNRAWSPSGDYRKSPEYAKYIYGVDNFEQNKQMVYDHFGDAKEIPAPELGGKFVRE